MIAEDDLLLADMLEETLIDSGYVVCGIAHTVEEAVKLGEQHKPDLAILDIGLAGRGAGTDVAAQLKRQGHVGVLYASGNASRVNLTKADGDALLVKPYRSDDVLRALQIVEHIVDTDGDMQRFPVGFSLLTGDANDTGLRAAAVALTLKNVRLRRQWAALAELGRFALNERDLGRVLQEAARVCTECFEAAYCTIYRYRPVQNDLLVEASVGWDQRVVGWVVPLAGENSTQGRPLIDRAALTGMGFGAQATSGQPHTFVETGIVMTLDVPIGSVNKPYGVLQIGNSKQFNYDDHDVDVLACIANILATAAQAPITNAMP